MIPILYDSQEKSFTSNGIGRLYDAISCTVNEKRNGAFTLSLQYPRCGKYANELRIGRIIGAVHDSKRKLQAFDIVSVTRDTAGVIDVEAQHVSYRLKNVLTRMHMMSLAVSPAVYMNILNDDIQKELTAEDKFLSCKSDFRFHSDVDEAYVREFLEISSDITFAPPDMDLGDNVYDLLLSRDGIMSRKLVTDNTSTSVTGYGDCGDFIFDMYDVSFLKERGVDVGVKVRTGVNVKNITITEQDDKIQAVMPVWIGRDKYDGLRVSANLWESNKQGDALVYDSAFNGEYSYVRCQKLDLSSVFETKPTPAQLRAEAERYLKEHRIMTKNKHKTYSVDIVESDRDTALLQKSDLCDIVTVEDVDSRTREKLKIVEVTYDVLRDLYTHMVISKPDPTILELVDNRTKKIEEKVDKALTQVADVAQKTDVENEVYPTSYNPAHPESWTNPGGELTDAEGNKVEQVATINRRPVFVKTVGGGSSCDFHLCEAVRPFIITQADLLKVFTDYHDVSLCYKSSTSQAQTFVGREVANTIKRIIVVDEFVGENVDFIVKEKTWTTVVLHDVILETTISDGSENDLRFSGDLIIKIRKVGHDAEYQIRQYTSVDRYTSGKSCVLIARVQAGAPFMSLKTLISDVSAS